MQLEFRQFLPITLEEAWTFFSTPHNLNRITPEEMHFEMLGEVPSAMYQGMIICYRIRPVPFLSFRWVTEITVIKDRAYFIDEQRSGPYKIWHHEHHFETVEGGVMMTDRLYYEIGWGILGKLAGWLWVHGQVRHIFEYREKVLADIFNAK